MTVPSCSQSESMTRDGHSNALTRPSAHSVHNHCSKRGDCLERASVEIETVTDAILADEFSLSRQKKITALRQQLAVRAQSRSAGMSWRRPRKKFSPSPPLDTIAMQARLYAFEQKGQTAEEARFLAEHIRRHPANSLQMRMLLLDLLQRLDDGAAWNKTVAETVAEAAKKTGGRPELRRVSARPPPPWRTCRFRRSSPCRIPRSAASSPPRVRTMYADALEIAARAQYAACRLDPAIDLQKKAVAVREKKQEVPFLNRSRKASPSLNR